MDNGKRKIIQLTSTSGVGPNTAAWLMSFALCDDGTVWSMGHWHGERKGQWVREQVIPQDETKPNLADVHAKAVEAEVASVKEELNRLTQKLNSLVLDKVF